MAAAEGAEAAGFDADVGEVDVAVDDVSDDVADGLFPQVVRNGDDDEQIAARGVEKPRRVLDADVVARQCAVENSGDLRPGAGQQRL